MTDPKSYITDPKSDMSTYYVELCGGAMDGHREVLPDEIVDAGVDKFLVNGWLYHVTDQLIAPNVYKAILVGRKCRDG